MLRRVTLLRASPHSSFPAKPSNNKKAASAAVHYSFGASKGPAQRRRDKKDFHDLFEFKDTVGKDTAFQEVGKYSWWRLFWARPIDHADDNEVEFKKTYERNQTWRGHYKALYELGEDTISRVSPPGSRFVYLRENLGGLLTLQLILQLVATLVAFGMLEAGLFHGQTLHDWWNRVMPFELDFVTAPRKPQPPPQPGVRAKTEEELAADAGWWYPFTLMPASQLESLYTAYAIGAYSLPFQLVATWALHARVNAWYQSLFVVGAAKRMARQAFEEAERAAKRPKVV